MNALTQKEMNHTMAITITDLRTLPGDSAFLLDDGKTAILYDTGFGFTGPSLAQNLKSTLQDRSLDYILLTHSHYDHALGSVHVEKAYPDVKVVAHSYAVEVFSRPSARSVMQQLDQRVARMNGITDYEDLTDQLKVDIAVQDGDSLICGDLRFTVVGLPGHTKCSIGFYLPAEKLLLGTETLGVYFGQDIYLPSYLVGYGLTLDAYEKVRKLGVEKMLLPHYGVVEKAEAEEYLDKAEKVSREAAEVIKFLFQDGKNHQDIAAHLEQSLYKTNVAPIYPVDAFRLNTDFMIELIKKELI